MLWAKPEIQQWIGAGLVTVTQLAESGASIEYQRGYVAALATLGAVFGVQVKATPMPQMIDARQ